MEFKSKKGLLFYLSGDSFTADFAKGIAEPSFKEEVSIISDGVCGNAIQCDERQALAWWAPHNIYAQRGTLSFFWRSRYPVGPTEFPIFRVGFADHTSWDACWLRIDYNGMGFDAMITDINLSRARVSCKVDHFPKPDEWVHLALSWEETYGIKFYINGKLAAKEYRPAVYDAGLDQFGPHSRIISNWHVVSDYNFIRGGDIDEIVIYDHMLEDEDIAKLVKLIPPDISSDYSVNLNDGATSIDWMHRNGFDVVLPAIPNPASVRKVEVHDAYDLKRWYWKACDGIRETTWPGVYNRSKLKGRNDYFQLPDWDCYSLSGKAITFYAPDEPYNRIDIFGSAHGSVDLVDDQGNVKEHFFQRDQGRERTANFIREQTGGKIRFTNQVQEEPIGDISLFNVKKGCAPKGSNSSAVYKLIEGYDSRDDAQVELVDFIKGRHGNYERNIMVAKECDNTSGVSLEGTSLKTSGYPFYNIILPYKPNSALGLDGIEITFSAVKTSVSYAIQIKDPLWYYRNLLHFTFTSTSEDERQQTVWFDTRDRILPDAKCLYITIATSRALSSDELNQIRFRPVFKDAKLVIREHSVDRFTQARDVFGHLAEERPNQKEYNMYNRFVADIDDLMKIDPDHVPGKYYHFRYGHLLINDDDHRVTRRPLFAKTEVPDGIPAWAYRQVEFLKCYKYVVNWYIDNRQIENGEFGGGLSDDGDFTSIFVGLIQMGCNHDKVLESLKKCTEAFYEQGMFTNGLCSIQTDELHSAEEGIISLVQCLATDYGNPLYLERAMENARSAFWLTGINKAGHRHFRSKYFSGSKMATEDPWGGQAALSGLALVPSWYIVRFNGNEKIKKLMLELADGLSAHYNRETGIIHSQIRFEDDDDSVLPREKHHRGELYLLLPAYELTRDKKYFECIPEHFKKLPNTYVTYMNKYNPECEKYVNKDAVAKQYDEWNYLAKIREYYNTLGSPWIDRVKFDYHGIQYDRMGGIAHERLRYVYPLNKVCWKFDYEDEEEKLAILSPVALQNRLKMIICNISDDTVHAHMIGGEINPGRWSIDLGIDNNDDDVAEVPLYSDEIHFERSTQITLDIPPRCACVLKMQLVKEGIPYDKRCDLGLSKNDIQIYDHGMNIRIHSLGNVASTEVEVVLKNAQGEILREVLFPPLEAPTDLWPKYRDIVFNLYDIPDLTGFYIEIDPYDKLYEITKENNIVKL